MESEFTEQDSLLLASLEEDEQQVGRVRDRINCCHLGTVELTDVLSNFPDVSLVLIEEIIDKLVKEGTLCKAGTESYTIIKQKNCEFEAVKEEMEGHVVANGKNAQEDMGEDHMYMKASLEEDEQQVGRVKDRINCCHLGTVELTDVLSNFPDVSLVLIEEIIDKLVKEGTLCKAGTESYTIIKQKNCEFEAVKEEMEGHVVANGKNAQVDMGEDHMYMKASPEEDEQEVGRVKDWINCCHLGTVELTDVLSNFPDISLVITEEIIDKLVKEGTLSKAGTESYTIMKQKNCECEFEAVKEEMKGHVVANGKNAQVDMGENHMYMKTRKLLLACFFLALAPSLVEGQVGQFALALQWIPSKCHHELGKACIPRFLHVEDLTIHGLWVRDGFGNSLLCKNLPSVGRHYAKPPRGSLINNLASSWPNLYGRDQRLWKHEYKTHGICFFQTSADYLADGLDIFQLAKQYLGMPITDPLFPHLSISTGIVAGSSYAPVDIVSRVLRRSILGVSVVVRCGTSRGKSIIREIDICAIRVHGSLQLANCSGNLFHSCLNVGRSLALLPSPPQPPIISSSPPPLPPSTPITPVIPIVAPQFPLPQPLPPTLLSPTPLTLPPSSTPPLKSPSPPASPPLKSPSPSASPPLSSPPFMSLPPLPSPSPTQFSVRVVIRISVTVISSFFGAILLVIYPVITFWRFGREQEKKKKKKKKKKRR